MRPEELSQVQQLHHQGFSERAIATKTGLHPSSIHRAVANIQSEALAKQSEAADRSEAVPVVVASVERSLVGMRLSPKELLDAKDAMALPTTAYLDAWGQVEVRVTEPLWPAYSQTGDTITLSDGRPAKNKGGNTYPVLRPEEPRPARVTADLTGVK